MLELVDNLLGFYTIINLEIVQVIYPCFEGVQMILPYLLSKLLGNINSLFNLKKFQVGFYNFLDNRFIIE
jgi:hypothetical protein